MLKQASTRAIGIVAIATLLVVAMVFLMGQSRMSAQQEIIAEDDLRGVELLAAQAKNLDAAEERKNAGENMASIDGMMNKFTTAAMPDFTKDLLKVAPKAEDDFAVKPNRFGVVPQKKGIHPVVNENMDDLDNDDDILLQTGGDWTPQGQPGLAAEISKSREKEEADEMKSDGLKGHSVLSAVGLTKDNANEEAEVMDAEELALFQAPPSHLNKDGKIPQAITKKIPVVKTLKSSLTYDEHPDYEKEEEDEVERDFGGSDILSAIGMGSLKQKPELERLGRITKDDLDFSLDDDDDSK